MHERGERVCRIDVGGGRKGGRGERGRKGGGRGERGRKGGGRGEGGGGIVNIGGCEGSPLGRKLAASFEMIFCLLLH
eukprot:760385-Hanusia_phi.AAC.1